MVYTAASRWGAGIKIAFRPDDENLPQELVMKDITLGGGGREAEVSL